MVGPQRPDELALVLALADLPASNIEIFAYVPGLYPGAGGICNGCGERLEELYPNDTGKKLNTTLAVAKAGHIERCEGSRVEALKHLTSWVASTDTLTTSPVKAERPRENWHTPTLAISHAVSTTAGRSPVRSVQASLESLWSFRATPGPRRTCCQASAHGFHP